MALKNNWIDIVDGQSEIVGDDINNIAHAVIEIEDDKEDKTNKINSWDEIKEGMDGTEQYPSMNMMMQEKSSAVREAVSESNSYTDMITGKLEDNLEACGDFVKIYEDTLTESTTTIEKTFDTNYKELYIRFVIPCAYNESSTEKARFSIYTLNDSGESVNKLIYHMGNWVVEDYKATDKVTDWIASIQVKMLGNYARTELWHEMSNSFNNAYARYQNTSTISGCVAPSSPTKREYLPAIKVRLYSANDIRSFPAGTTYEMWGVKA